MRLDCRKLEIAENIDIFICTLETVRLAWGTLTCNLSAPKLRQINLMFSGKVNVLYMYVFKHVCSVIILE